MGMYCTYRCDGCAHEVDTWGPREFFVDAAGAREGYGHPFPTSDEAKARGMSGLDAKQYCRACGANPEVVVAEFTQPVFDPLRAWSDEASGGARQKKLDPPTCPKCGSGELLAVLPDDPPLRCPHCASGHLMLAGGSFT